MAVEIRPWKAHRGVFQGRRPLPPGLAGFAPPGRPGRGTPGPASLEMTMRDPRLPAAIVGCGDAGQLGSSWLLALFLGVQPAALQLAPAVEVGHGLGKPLFLLNLLFLGCRAAAVLDECAGGGAATGAACRALGKPVLADRPGTIAGGGAGEAGGTPEGCPAEGAGRREAAGRRERSDRRVGAPAGRLGGSIWRRLMHRPGGF